MGHLVGRGIQLQRLRSLLDDGARGVVIAGAAGTGKTRLAQAFCRLAAKQREVVWVFGSSPATSIPFGAFAPLLPETFAPDASALTVLQAARAALRERAGGRPLVLAVDDAHTLDDCSATLLHQVMADDEAFVLLTVRRGEAMPDPVVAVEADERVAWIEVGPLAYEDGRQLAEQILGGPIDGSTLGQLWGRAGGNPLFTTELVQGGRDAGVLVREGKVWHATGRLTVPGRLHEVLAGRLRTLPEGARGPLQLLAVAERFELPLLERICAVTGLEVLEQRGLVRLDTARRRTFVAVAHPLYAEVTRAELPGLAVRRTSGALADQLLGAGLRRREDLLRWATWQLASGRPADADTLLAAARRAKTVLDPALAERCADVAVACGGGFEARLLRAEARAVQGRVAEGEAEFALLADRAGDDAERAQVALAHSTTLLFHLGDRRTLDVLAAAADAVTEPPWRDELEAMRVFAAAYLGELPRAVEDGRRLLERLPPQGAPFARVAVIHTYALALMGRYEAAEPAIAQGLEATARHPEAFPIATHLLQVNRTFGLASSGRIRDAERLARACYAQAVAAEAAESQGLWASNVGLALAFRGRLTEAVRFVDEALALLRANDPVGMLLIALSLAAQVHAMRGDRARARALLDEYAARAEGRVPAFGTVWRHRVDAWLDEGFGEAAARRALEAGEIGAREHQVVFGSLALHDAVRFGYPGAVLAPLEDLAAHAEGALVPALAAHARHLRDGNPDALEQLAGRFQTLGADLYAAETAAQASHLHARVGARERARADRQRALALAGEEARCPTLWLWIGRPGELTDREYEVARLAARGLSDQAIAARLVISPRTVGNHLSAVYRKLGVSGRTGLVDLVAGTDSS